MFKEILMKHQLESQRLRLISKSKENLKYSMLSSMKLLKLKMKLKLKKSYKR